MMTIQEVDGESGDLLDLRGETLQEDKWENEGNKDTLVLKEGEGIKGRWVPQAHLVAGEMEIEAVIRTRLILPC